MDEMICLKVRKENRRLKWEVLRLKEALAYALREHEAYRKVSEARVRDAESKGKESLLKEMFILLEDMDRLLSVLSGEDVPENVRSGALSIVRKVEHTLKVLGVEKIVPEVGKPFDPSTMEALTVIKDENLPKGSVGVVYEPGWKYNGKLLKPARVGVVG